MMITSRTSFMSWEACGLLDRRAQSVGSDRAGSTTAEPRRARMPGPRVFTAAEVQGLIPKVERQFARMEKIRERLKTTKIRINALEMIWGDKVHEAENPDHGELQQHIAELKSAEEEFERASKAITQLGGQVKGVDPPLVDFYGVREGRLIFWCWTRGETSIGHWHHIDQGFADRQEV
jgi:hypothetical protein